MVKKLIKYDLLAYLRSLFPIDMVLLGIAVLTRVIQFFEPAGRSTAYQTFFVSSIVALVIAGIVALVMTVALCVVRFYRGLFGAEGYLSLTLPVSHSRHLLAKVSSSLLATVITCISVILAWCIASAGEMLAEVIKAALYLYRWLGSELGKVNMAMWIPEAIVFAIVAVCCAYLLLYLCLTIGQMARKNRILAAVGVFFGYYLLNQLLGTVIILILSISPAWLMQLIENLQAMEQNILHLILCGGIAWLLVWSVIYGLLIRLIMKRKLNLE